VTSHRNLLHQSRMIRGKSSTNSPRAEWVAHDRLRRPSFDLYMPEGFLDVFTGSFFAVPLERFGDEFF
jgi:hypothetical protein